MTRIKVYADAQGLYTVRDRATLKVLGRITNDGLKGRWYWRADAEPGVRVEVTRALHDDELLASIVAP
jgi:hypothetical protein